MSSIDKYYKSVYEKGFKEAFPIVYKVFAGKRKFQSTQIQRMWDAYTRAKTS